MRISDWSADVCSSDLAARRWRRRRSSRSIATSGWFPLVGWRRPGRRPQPGLSQRYRRCLPVPPPLRRQHRVDDLVGPFALDDLVLAEMRLAPHPELLHDPGRRDVAAVRSEEHTSELQSLMRISYAVFCLKKKNKHKETLK